MNFWLKNEQVAVFYDAADSLENKRRACLELLKQLDATRGRWDKVGLWTKPGQNRGGEHFAGFPFRRMRTSKLLWHSVLMLPAKILHFIVVKLQRVSNSPALVKACVCLGDAVKRDTDQWLDAMIEHVEDAIAEFVQ